LNGFGDVISIEMSHLTALKEPLLWGELLLLCASVANQKCLFIAISQVAVRKDHFNVFQSISKVLLETIFFILCGRKVMQGGASPFPAPYGATYSEPAATSNGAGCRLNLIEHVREKKLFVLAAWPRKPSRADARSGRLAPGCGHSHGGPPRGVGRDAVTHPHGGRPRGPWW
jgi:hypothetical protein